MMTTMKSMRGRLLLAVLIASSAAPGLAVAQATKSREIEPNRDTWIEEAAPAQAHGDEEELIARFDGAGGSRVLVGFDFKPLRNRHIVNAMLKLTVVGSEGEQQTQMGISAVTSTFTEKTTWQDQPLRSKTYGIQTAGTSGDLVWDVTALLRETLEANGKLAGFALSGPLVEGTAPYNRTFGSRESDTPASLSVQHSPGNKPVIPEESDRPPGAGQVRLVLGLLLLLVLVGGTVVFLLRRTPPPADQQE